MKVSFAASFRETSWQFADVCSIYLQKTRIVNTEYGTGSNFSVLFLSFQPLTFHKRRMEKKPTLVFEKRHSVPETNIARENRPSKKEIHLPILIFSGLC